MAQRKASQIMAAMARVLPKKRIEQLARECGVVKRQRRVDIVALVHALVLASCASPRRSMSGLKRSYEQATGTTIARSSFHQRFNAELVVLLRKLTDEAMGLVAESRPKLRLVSVFSKLDKRRHRYITNLPASRYSAEKISALYSGRWEIELLFRELKSIYQMGQLPSRNLFATQALVLASILTLLVSRRIFSLVRKGSKPLSQTQAYDRWAKIFNSVAMSLLGFSLCSTGRAERENKLLRFLRKEALDPNRSRQLLLARVATGKAAFA